MRENLIFMRLKNPGTRMHARAGAGLGGYVKVGLDLPGEDLPDFGLAIARIARN
jgi:hypothetical protein